MTGPAGESGRGIGAAARRSGLPVETIRYYERIGLVPAPPRTAGGQRLYDGTLIQRLAFIRRCRDLGFALADVRALLRLADGGADSCGEVRDLTLRHAAAVRGKIDDLERLERVLRDMAAQCADGDMPACPIVEALSA